MDNSLPYSLLPTPYSLLPTPYFQASLGKPELESNYANLARLETIDLTC